MLIEHSLFEVDVQERLCNVDHLKNITDVDLFFFFL